ncbi:MAG: hypothetical protein R2909_15670 [Gemmatimonadales bacterium]
MTRRGRAFGFVTGLTLAVWLMLSVANAPLRTEAAPAGIVSFELAGSAEKADAVIRSWGPRQREAASFGLGLDFLFLLLYPTAISLAVAMVTERLILPAPRLAHWGRTISLALPAAAVLDAVENAALWRMLQLGATDGWARTAAVAASIKFALVAVGLLFLPIGLALARRRPGKEP